MKTGDTVRDGLGSTYQVGQLLGRGLWGKSYVVRHEASDALKVLKCPLGPEDFRGEVPASQELFAACRDALLEQARLYDQGEHPFFPRMESRFTLPDGQPAIVLPRFPDTLERRMAEGMPVSALLDTLVIAARHLKLLGGQLGGIHGSLRPSNFLFNDKGELFLSDPATPAVRRAVAKLHAVAPGGQPYLPPELTEASGEPPWSPGADTYAMAMILWRALSLSEPSFPRGGLDKAGTVALKDRLADRMKAEDSNARFHARLGERTGVLLARALSREVGPSPPFRFGKVDELHQRIEELVALVRPQVTSVGKVLVDRPAAKPWFDTDESAAFSCTVGTSVGVEGPEEIGVGLAVFDRDQDRRLRELDTSYTCEKHPSGRYRFGFRVGGLGGAVSLPPGRYRVRIAFAIRDSGQPPATAEVEIEVRAAPGWVPVPEPPPPGALPFQREVTGTTEPGAPDPSTETRPPPVAEAPPPPPPSIAAPSSPPAPPRLSGASVTPGAAPATSPAPAPQRAPPAPRAGSESPTMVPVAGSAAAAAAAAGTGPPPERGFARPVPPVADPPERPAVAAGAAPVPTPVTPTPPAAKIQPATPPSKPEAPPEDEAYERPQNWSYEPLPRPAKAEVELEPDRPSQVEEDPDSTVEPGLVEKGIQQVRGDPYVMVMFGLAALIAVLLAVFLVVRS